MLFGQLSLFLCAPTQGCWHRAAFIRTPTESKTKLRSTVGTSTVFPGLPFSALHGGKEPAIVPQRFLLASSRTAPEQHAMVQFSHLCNPQPLQSQLETFTTALLWVDDKILSPVPLSLHVWVMLQQRREKYRSDYRCLVVSVISQHALPPTWPKFWKYKSSNITFNTVPNWQRWGLCHRFYPLLVLQ